MLHNSTHLLLSCLTEIGTVRALSLAIMAKYDDFTGLLTISKVQPSSSISPEKYLLDSQAMALFTKYQDLVIPGVDRRAAALKTWWSAEHACYRSNETLSPFLHHSFPDEDLGVADFLFAVRKKILSWIGSKPPDLDKIRGRFGPGSTFSDKGRLTTVPDKMSSTTTLTPSAYWYLLPYVKTFWGRKASEDGRTPVFVRGNRFTTVPKTALIDRGIAIEPAINLFYQLGLGTAIRVALKNSTGWDLDTAQTIHRLVARESSVSGEFATLDLSMASDTVCRVLVELLLPPCWFRELNCLRSSHSLVDGRWVRLEKFSSMGNGYTFELETLIFAALASTWSEFHGRLGRLGHEVFVFGDDIIIESEIAKGFVSVLSFCGFKLNLDKSFLTGPFRESCGGDYWGGFDVRPWFRKRSVVQPLDFVRDLNGLRRTSEKLKSFHRSLDLTWKLWLLEIPLPYRNFRGPDALGDIIIHDHPDRWRFKWKNSIRSFQTFSLTSRHLPWHHWKPEIVLASALYGVGNGALGVIPRDPPSDYVVRWVPFS